MHPDQPKLSSARLRVVDPDLLPTLLVANGIKVLRSGSLLISLSNG
jgi:hypothetical protein